MQCIDAVSYTHLDFVSKNYRFPAFPDGEQWKSVSIQDTTEASDGTVH